MKARIGVVALVAVLASGGAMAADLKYDGNELLKQCQQYIKAADGEANYNGSEAGLCLGFLQGVNSTFGFVADEITSETKFCAPDRMANGQLVRVVVKYLTDNPKKLHLPQTGLVWFALKDAYPCK